MHRPHRDNTIVSLHENALDRLWMIGMDISTNQSMHSLQFSTHLCPIFVIWSSGRPLQWSVSRTLRQSCVDNLPWLETKRNRMNIDRVVWWWWLLTFLFCELMQQTRLAHAHITNYNILEYVVIVVRTARHCEYYERKREQNINIVVH